MAGDWIPMRTDLHDDPAVIQVAAALGLDEYGVIGRLHRLWVWANKHLTDGCALGVTPEWVDRYIGTPNFAAALLHAGWLRVRSGGVQFPHFDRWNSQGAKRRVLAAGRMRKTRCAPSATSGATKAQPEKRREEKRREDASASSGRAAPAAPEPTPEKPPPRKRNELFDAIAEVTGADATTAGSLLGSVAAMLAKADPPYTPGEVREFGRRFWSLCPWAANERAEPTPKELQTYIGKLRAGPSNVAPVPPRSPPTFDRGAAQQARIFGEIRDALEAP